MYLSQQEHASNAGSLHAKWPFRDRPGCCKALSEMAMGMGAFHSPFVTDRHAELSHHVTVTVTPPAPGCWQQWQAVSLRLAAASMTLC